MEKQEKVQTFPSARWTLALIGFLGCVFIYALRINLSVAIVCMVREPEVNVTNGNNVTAAPDLDGCGQLEKSSRNRNKGEFDWNKEQRGWILSSFFIGYIFTQLPGGRIASTFGGKHVHGTGMLITAIATLLLPVCARTSPILVIVLRIIMGFGTGVSFPAIMALWGRWAPPLESSRLITVTMSGTIIGNIITLSVSGLLCDSGVDGGWPLIFYVFGGGALLWYFLWLILVYNTPDEHPRISDIEREYINGAIAAKTGETRKDSRPIPWLAIATSPPVYAIIIAHIGNNFGNYTLLTSLPTYMKEVLKFDIKSNGVLSALPYMTMFVTTIIGGQVVDRIRQRRIVSDTVVRKTVQAIGFLGPAALMVGVGFLDCTKRSIAVALLTVAVGLTFGSRSGYNVSAVDIAPRYAGIIFGISNTIATVPGILSPIAVGTLTTNGTREEWQRVFYICAAFYTIGAIAFALMSSAEPQKWATAGDVMEPEVIEVKVTEKNPAGIFHTDSNIILRSYSNKALTDCPL